MASNTITIAQITTSVTAKPTDVSERIQNIVSQACSERSMAVESQARVASVVHLHGGLSSQYMQVLRCENMLIGSVQRSRRKRQSKGQDFEKDV